MPVGVTDLAPGANVADVDALLMAIPEVSTTLTADPTTGATWAVANGGATSRFPQSGNFLVTCGQELALVTAGQGSNSWTVTRGQHGTTNVAHANGSAVYRVGQVQRVNAVSKRQVSYVGSVVTFRTLGNAASPQNLFSLENQAGSTVLVAIRKLTAEQDSTVVLTAVTNQFKVSRPASLPTGGTSLTKVPTDTSLTHNTSVVARGATASDGAGATAITATAGTTMWCQFANRAHTAVGQMRPDDMTLIPVEITDRDGIILRANESILVQIVNPTAASNAATNHWAIRCAFEEYRLLW